MKISPAQLYLKCADKQRIVITGNNRKILVELVIKILTHYNRKFSFYSDGSLTDQPDSPIVLIEDNEHLLAYHHHICVIAGDFEKSTDDLNLLLKSSPKSGLFIYPETNHFINKIDKNDFLDVQLIPYHTIRHELKNGNVVLISRSNQEFTLPQTVDQQALLLLSATKELVKKIGISSEQFYQSIISFM